jgi:RNA polymerase sigma-70 factor, ECF subfamily
MAMRSSASGAAAAALRGDGGSRALGFVGDDARLVDALRERHPTAIAAFHDRFAPRMLRIMARIMGQSQDLEDALHDAFVRALGAIGTLADPSRLDSWMTSVAVLTARTWLQRRWRQRWLTFMAPDDIAELAHPGTVPDPALAEAVRATYTVLDRLGTNDRIFFALRFIEGMELEAIASACRTSLTTVKRRLKRAETRFAAIARNQPALAEWVEEGGRWRRI